MSRIAVAYFSASGTTARLAKTIAAAVGGDLLEIRPAVPYTDADLNWRDANSRSTLEMKDKASRPEMDGSIGSLAPYDTVFVGFPIWWYEAPRIIQTFLESQDFSQKTVISFATSGGSGLGKTAAILQKSCPDAEMLDGRRMSPSASAAEVSAWIKELEL